MRIVLSFQGSGALLEGASNRSWVIMTIDVVKNLGFKLGSDHSPVGCDIDKP